MSEKKIVVRLTAVGVTGNILLVAFKLYAGIAGHSGAMVSDAVHSLSDVFATFIAFIGVKLAQKGPDRDHPYGHDRLECLASTVLGVILLATGLGIGWGGLQKIIAGHYESLAVPGGIALAAAIVSIVVKEGMFWYTRHYARKLNSSAFMADAWHHRSDALSSVGSLIGIGGAMLGVPVLGSQLALSYTDDCLTAVEGTFYTGGSSITRVSEQEAISAADALAQLLARRDALGWVGSAVTGLTQAYLPSDQAGTGIRFVPVWLVETDAGSFFINGITREITAET